MGYALFLAQMGERHQTMTKMLQGFGGGTVVEVKESHEGNAYRAVYTVRYADAVYVLHAFQKKIEDRQKHAESRLEHDREAPQGADRRQGETAMTKMPAAKDPMRNVWLQLGFPDAETHYLKAELVLRLDKAIKALGLTQRVAARRIGTTQPELSKILRGKFSEVSLERLMRFLTALGHQIEIKIGAVRPRKVGNVIVKDVRRRAA
jgi:predicted XRE-type DNA-binding protein